MDCHLAGRTASPIVGVSDVVALSVSCGLGAEGAVHLLKYLHDVGSLLFFSRHAALEDVVFPSSVFVIDVFKAVFRHDHDRLCYDDERFGDEGITGQQFNEMKEDLVQNATVRIPMLRALWSEFLLSCDRHFEVFLKMFLSFDFAYLVTSSEDVARRFSENLRQRGLIIHCSSVYDLQPSGSRTRSAGRAEAAETIEEVEEERTVKGDFVSVLERNNVGLLLPWLLRDEEPPEVGQHWSECNETDSVQVSQVLVRYSFTYNVPLGLFERLSARCHRHSTFIHHWRSGLLLRYGPVTLLFRCDRNPSSASITLRGRVLSSKNSCVRLWHVLLRCVTDLENLLLTIPGVLVDGFLHDETSSGLSGSSRSSAFLKFRPGTSCLPLSKKEGALIGALVYSESEHLEAIEQGSIQYCSTV